MSKKETGGPAFPGVDHVDEPYPGMTLRDYFAAKAMQGMCVGTPIPHKTELSVIAQRSYEMADAMLEARKC